MIFNCLFPGGERGSQMRRGWAWLRCVSQNPPCLPGACVSGAAGWGAWLPMVSAAQVSGRRKQGAGTCLSWPLPQALDSWHLLASGLSSLHASPHSSSSGYTGFFPWKRHHVCLCLPGSFLTLRPGFHCTAGIGKLLSAKGCVGVDNGFLGSWKITILNTSLL